jgi:hypothetical protein
MDEQITVRKISDDDGEHSRWALLVGSEPVVAIRTADTLPKAKAVEYLFSELVRKPQ